MLRVTSGPSVYNPGEPKSKWPLSTTVWRHDLPLAVVPRHADAAGIIFTPRSTHPLCAYPINAKTFHRRSYKADNISVRDSCGVSARFNGEIFSFSSISGECKFATAQEYASAYYFKPMVGATGDFKAWPLQLASCHFTSVPLMLDAQKLLLQRSMHTPPGTNDRDWLSNATGCVYRNRNVSKRCVKSGGSVGLTAFNEVVIAPYEPSEVGGVFWAHPGPFRSPASGDSDACRIAKYLKELPPGATPLPIFEFAAVNLQMPFSGCYSEDPSGDPRPAPDCLPRGLGYWQSNMTGTEGYGSNFSNVFRTVSASVFLTLSCTNEEQHVVFV